MGDNYVPTTIGRELADRPDPRTERLIDREISDLIASDRRQRPPSPVVPERKSRRGDRHHASTPPKVMRRRQDLHTALRAVRPAVMLSDLAATVAAVALGTRFDAEAGIAVPAVWLAISLIKSSLADRTAALVDPRPYLKSNVHLALTVTTVSVLASDLHSTRVALALSGVLALMGLASRTVLKNLSATGLFAREGRETVLVVGRRDSVARTISEWQGIQSLTVVGACLAQADERFRKVGDIPVLGSVADVADVARQMGVDIVALHDVDQLGGLQLARLQYALEAGGTQLSVITPVTNVRVDRASVRRLGRRVIVDISYGTPRGITKAVKTLVDQVLSGLLLVLILPLLLICGVVVRLSSPGPMIFRQVRVGEGGTTFVMYKLRTMAADAEDRLEALLEHNEVGGGHFKMTHDPRITRVGHWLRRSSLDELPQLWNVFKGEMSLIGPRPALPSEVLTYDDVARRRLAVKPGMTGLWQVSGRSNLSWDETVRIDSDYIDNWRVGRELAIALRTLNAVVTRRGAR